MPTIERISKFNKSKSIYKKRKKKNKEQFELYNFEKQFIDGIKIKPLTKKIINKLIIQKSVVSIFGEYELERAIIISQNENFLVLIDFSEDYIYGQLGIYYVKFIINIELLKEPKAQFIKSNFNIYNLQYQYFNTINIKLPNEIIKKIKDYININNYLEFSKLSEKNNKELFLFIRDKIDIPCSIYVEDIEPELFGKLYDISDNYFNIKSVDLNHIFYTNLINIDMINIEYISLNIFNRNKEIEEYHNNNNCNNFINDVLTKIDINLKFINVIDTTCIESNNELFNIEYEEIKKIYYLHKNQDEIENFKKGYIHSKNIVENIKEYNIDYNSKNDYVDIILEDDETISNVIILENNKEYLIVIDNDSNFKVFKKYIKKIIQNYDIYRLKAINSYVNNDFEGKCVWIETIFFGWCFIVNKVNNNHIIVTAIDSKCIISNKTYIIHNKDIVYIEFQSDYFNFINNCYNKYKNNSILKNYQEVHNDIIKNKKEYFDNKIGFEWILGNLDFYIRPDTKLLFCSIFDKNKNNKLNFSYKLSSLYKIIENSYEELD